MTAQRSGIMFDVKPHTKPRSVRVPDDEWQAATKAAAERGETVTDVIRRALRQYAIKHARESR